ncbi:hypothetical protein DIS18_12125 [Algibacter marinivivus]|uniref:Uncharacterized protein n=1 Tax=Algibacter marinivivus TaxID=2100723 RepID=A0A2U2X2L1_9FLAO|nr:hypothetical protein [Algibacter marinivivus]PWH82007.1 hypothetical protein DIS18_12125 [Algibacter marinivivus]
MVKKINFKETSEKEINLYTCLGESLCAVQILEDALSHLIILKKTEPDQKKVADDLLKKQQFYTFGRAIKIAKDESLLPNSLETELSSLLKERNWLVHESITIDKNNYKTDSFFNELFKRTKSITLKAQKLKVSIELDLIEYSEKKGIDMSKVKNEMNKNYGLKF